MGERHHHDLSQLVQAAFQHVFRTRFAEEMESHRKANTAAVPRVQAFPTWLPAGVFERISATRNTAVNVQVVEADAPLVSPETRDTFEQRLLALSKHAECMICSYPMVLPGREPFSGSTTGAKVIWMDVLVILATQSEGSTGYPWEDMTHGIDASETGINYETDVVEDAELEGDGSDQYSMLPELESVLSSPPIAQQGTWLGSYEDS
ncbi:hypothetical protein BKA62DRAFT_673701 [Auriculariales sp. MPI-PUGE-AT-0066]|nr:hypothetical protein BKA62DRAFT_673701 [Auriculariales sp. MPI-PUGE-AT-0066]